MQISKINSLLQFSNYQNKEEKKKADTTPAVTVGLKSYPKGYRPYFGARLFRTPENFYEQEFNKKGMPITLRDYLNSNYEQNSKKPPAELHKEAFADLLLCENTDDVKEMFPQEFDETNPNALFTNLKALETIRPTGGYLYQMRAYGLGNKDVLQSGEDLTVYLLKKIFYECKDLDEINADFDKDRKAGLERDIGYCNEGAYFLHSTLKSIGVRLPDKAYWKSLQANRTDKEYTPYTFVLTKPRKKPEFTKPRVRKPLNLSPEEIQRRKDMMVNRWIDMTPAQRQAQLNKMKEGQENSLFYQYASPIMYIAADRAHLQDKLFHFFRENKECSGIEEPLDLNEVNPKQAKAMKTFWANNSKARKSFAYFIKVTLREFEQAKEQGDEALGELLNKAATIRDKNAEKVLRRKLSNPETVKAELKKVMEAQISPFPDAFSNKYINFILNHDKFKNEIIQIKVREMFAKTPEEREKCLADSIKIMDTMFKEFQKNNKRDSISATTALAVVVRPFLKIVSKEAENMGKTNLAQRALKDSDEILTGPMSCILGTVEKYSDLGIKETINKFKSGINKVMVQYTTGFSDEEAKKHAKEITDYMKFLLDKNWGNYRKLNNPVIRKRCEEKLSGVYRDIERNKDERRNFINFIKDYEGLIKYSYNLIVSTMKKQMSDNLTSINENISALKLQKSDLDRLKECKDIQDYIYESIIDDYLITKERK